MLLMNHSDYNTPLQAIAPPALCEEGSGCCLDKSHDMCVKVMHTSYAHERQGDGRLSTGRACLSHVFCLFCDCQRLSTFEKKQKTKTTEIDLYGND